MDRILSDIFHKLLRRAKVVILKIDNWVSLSLGRIKESKDSKDQPNLFSKSEEDNSQS
jgi:hypothetical protein